MRRQVVRFLFDHRAIPQRVLRRLVPHPLRVEISGLKLYVRLDDWAVGARIAVKRSYEPHVSRIMRVLLKPGMTVLDIGANIGYFSMLAASRVGPDGRVLAFEPSVANLELLARSAAANGFANITPYALAVAEASRLATFSMDDSNGGIDRGQGGASATWIQAVALDQFLPQAEPIHLVKIDVEGCEGLAVRGMRELLARHRPILFSEFAPSALPRFSGMTADEYLALLRGPGYEIRVIPSHGELPAPQTDTEIMGSYQATRNDHVDLLATPIR